MQSCWHTALPMTSALFYGGKPVPWLRHSRRKWKFSFKKKQSAMFHFRATGDPENGPNIGWGQTVDFQHIKPGTWWEMSHRPMNHFQPSGPHRPVSSPYSSQSMGPKPGASVTGFTKDSKDITKIPSTSNEPLAIPTWLNEQHFPSYRNNLQTGQIR